MFWGWTGLPRVGQAPPLPGGVKPPQSGFLRASAPRGHSGFPQLRAIRELLNTIFRNREVDK